MFGVDWQEFLIIGIVALIVIGPKDLPRAMRVAGQWMGKARATARHFRSGLDTMIREAELEEMNARWAEQNKAIMAGSATGDFEQAADSANWAMANDAPSPRAPDGASPSPLEGEGQSGISSPLPSGERATRAKRERGEGVPRKPRKRVAPE